MVNLSKQTFNIPEPSVITYDWIDVASKTGYILFDGFTDSSGSYHLSANASYSKDVSLVTGNLQGTSSEYGTFTTSSFNYPARMSGDMYVFFSFDNAAGAGSGDADAKIEVKIYHNTDLLTTLDSHTISAAAASDAETAVISYTVSDTNIKIGDVLKITLKAYETGGSRACTVRLGCDPTNAGDTNIDTSADGCSTARLILAVPFKIDI